MTYSKKLLKTILTSSVFYTVAESDIKQKWMQVQQKGFDGKVAPRKFCHLCLK